MLEPLVALFAPHHCLVCGLEGAVACGNCLSAAIKTKRSTCFLCNQLTNNYVTCKTCRRRTKVTGAYIVAHYGGVLKRLILELKYHRKRDAVRALAPLLVSLVPQGKFDLITNAPAASSRFRARGYNQAALLAKELARLLGVPYVDALGRLGNTRQVGTRREQRFRQLADQIYCRTKLVSGQRLLVVDDVITTGATVHECAQALKAAGAKAVWAAAIAKH